MKLGLEDDEMQIYLKALDISEPLNLTNSVETLFLLSNRQFIHIPYQNIDLHLRKKKPKSLTLQALLQRLCIEQVGGLCYEQELLLYYVLKHLKFDVHPIRCQVRERGSKYNPEQPYTHDLLIIQALDFDHQDFHFKQIFLTYCEFSTQEKFRISENETHYQLEQMIDNSWVCYYDFQKPLKLGNIIQTENDYLNLYTYPKFLGPRDSRFVICKNNEQGRVFYMWFRLEKKFTAFRKIITQFNVTKLEFENFEDFKEDIYKILIIQLPNFEQF